MAHFAQIDENNTVTRVLVIEQDAVNTGLFGEPNTWVQTSYNTIGGVHTLGGTPLRKNYAGIGFTYDSVKDAFIPPAPYASWTLDEDACQWQPPIPMPVEEGKIFVWGEEALSWVELAVPS
jgi:hypothetical protein